MVLNCSRSLCLAIALGGVLAAPAVRALDVQRLGSFAVGGRVVTLQGLPVREVKVAGANFTMKVDPNGHYMVDQMYVQYVKLRHPRAKYPLIFFAGGGMTGSEWEDTPDGRAGWETYFLRHGWDVYLIDPVGRGRSGFAPPEVTRVKPIYPSAEGTWYLARMGPPGSFKDRVGFPGVKYPLSAFDNLMKMRVPSWETTDIDPNSRDLLALIRKVGPCVLIAHSSGGPYAMQAALQVPDLVKAVVELEPAGAPNPGKADAARASRVPHLFINGDFLNPGQITQKAVAPVRAWRDALVAAHGTADWIELPKLGITGNTHVMMMDTNSDRIASLVQAWLARQKLMGHQ